MAISVVNGYLCYSGCDAAKARTGQNPHPASSGAPGSRQAGSDGGDAAVIFGGSLSGLNGNAASTSATSGAKPAVNILA
jgi:hypothetical protein